MMVAGTRSREKSVATDLRHRPEPKNSAGVSLNELRVRKIMDTPLEFVPNPEFGAQDAESTIVNEDDIVDSEAARDSSVPKHLPGHLARLCQFKLLSADQERRLFRRMNYLKYRAMEGRAQLDPHRPDLETLDAIEEWCTEVRKIRDRIVQANFRLVISVIKKFVTAQNSFDELLSDGLASLMHAVDKFDYDRGFRFSTYAYRSIVFNTLRDLKSRNTEAAGLSVLSEGVVSELTDERRSSQQDEEASRRRSVLKHCVHQLDRRERFIIRSRYALGSHRRTRTFQDLADRLGISKERVRQLERRAVAKLKECAGEHSMGDVFA